MKQISRFFGPLIAQVERWQAARLRAHSDAQFWRAAQHDARIMAEITRAASQHAA